MVSVYFPSKLKTLFLCSFIVGMVSLGFSKTHCAGLADDFTVAQDTVDTCNIFLESAFSPNSDGTNDSFGPSYNCPLKYYKLQVFNRWGNIVFESDDPFERWDGNSDKGESFPSGTFFWMLEYSFSSSAKKEADALKGNVTLIR